ncbi:MAG TPA: universal stress protein [Candidatus Eisenbacteria bacterium]|nr:universal stress protein [Candidatus Eisenbacteria bacterium]
MTVVEFTKTAPDASAKRPFSALSVKNILFPTDFSPTSESALPYAVAIARRFGSTLHLLHVLSEANLLMMSGGVDYVSMGTIYEDAHAEAKEKLEKIAQRIEGVPHRIYARHGLIWTNLAGIIAENEVDLIVVGTHGRTGLGKLLLGSVAEGILRHAPCPVLTVGPKVSGRAKLPELSGRDLAPPEIDIQQILFATNFGRSAALVAGDAVSLAQEFHARLSLIHVVEDYTHLGSNPGPIEDNLQRLRELIPGNAQLQYVPEVLIEFGNAPEQILKAAAAREADMIILGAHSSSEVGGTHLPWSAAHHVIAQAHCPVLTIRQ